MRALKSTSALAVLIAFGIPATAMAGEGIRGWLAGDWYLTVGATILTAPDFEGSKKYMLSATPIISLGKAGNPVRFSSRNDNISLAVVDQGDLRAGVAGKFLWKRDNDEDAIRGLDPIRWGGEIGGFFEFYPLDWVRMRAEVRQGVRAHKGVVADIAVDAFHDVTPEVRISGGPRASFASSKYFDAYYGVSADEHNRTGISEYDPGGGVRSLGIGGAVTWKVSDPVTTSVFGEYSRLMGPAADSSIVRERGSRNQFTMGVSATYRFDFTM